MSTIFKKTLCTIVSTVVLISSFAGCSKGPEITKFEVEPSEIELEVGTTVEIDVSIRTNPRNEDIDIKYASSDDSVAEVDKHGVITAVGAGECEITVTAGSEEETIEVSVYELETYNVDDTISTDYFDYTLTDLRFVNALNTSAGSLSNSFFTPSQEGMTGGSGYHLLYFSFDYSYTGNSSLDEWYLEDAMFVPYVSYEDYIIDDNYFVFWQIDGGEWNNLASDISWTARQNMGLALADLMYTYEPLTNHRYVARGVISVPDSVYEDDDTPLTITFQLLTDASNSNYTFEGYTFEVR